MVSSAEKFFEMKKAQCKDVVEAYRKFLTRQDGVNDFLSLAEVNDVLFSRNRNLAHVLVYFVVTAGRRWAWTRRAT